MCVRMDGQVWFKTGELANDVISSANFTDRLSKWLSYVNDENVQRSLSLSHTQSYDFIVDSSRIIGAFM